MNLCLPVLRRLIAVICALAALSGAIPRSVSASGSDDQARTRLRAAYSKCIEAEWAEGNSNWTQAAAFYGDAVDLLTAVKRDYPGWQTELLDRRIMENLNRIEFTRAQTQPDAIPPPAPAVRENRLEQLLEELIRVRAILAETSNPNLTDGVESNPAAAALIRTNRVLQSEIAKLQKRIQTLEKKKKTGHGSPVTSAEALTNRLCVTLIGDTARSRIQSGQLIEAIDLLTEALSVFPEEPGLVRLLATAYCRAARYREAIGLISDLTAPPPETLVILGSAYLASGQLGPARRTFETCLKDRPDLAEASYNMAQLLLALDPPDIPGARTYYRKSLESGGERDQHLESLLGQAAVIENIKHYKRK